MEGQVSFSYFVLNPVLKTYNFHTALRLFLVSGSTQTLTRNTKYLNETASLCSIDKQ